MNLSLNELWQLRIACITPDQASVNVINWKVTALTGVVSDVFVCDLFDDTLAPLYKAVLADDATYYGCSFQRFFPLPRSRPAVEVDSQGAGVVAGEILPGQVAGIISAKTDFAGKSQRARIYIPFPSESSNEVPGLPTDVYVAAVQALANDLYEDKNIVVNAGVNEATLRPIVYHRENGTTDFIVAAKAKKLWATQRRRGSYGRKNSLPF